MDTGKLRVIIVGSGLAGLAAARVLREKHHVTVYERGDQAVATGGQGICIFPNGVKILEAHGYDRTRTKAVVQTGHRVYDKHGNMKSDEETDYRNQYGADTLAHMRIDLRDELFRLATTRSEDLNIQGEPAKIIFQTAVTDMDPVRGEVTLGDGSSAEADVIIVADGIHSRLRSCIAGPEYFAKKMGLSCFRVAISVQDAKAALGWVPDWWDRPTGKGRGLVFEAGDGSNRFIVAYPLRNFEYMNLSCIFPTDPEQAKTSTTATWYTEGDRSQLLEIFADFAPDLIMLLRIATQVKLWDLQDLDPLPKWTLGKALLIGDAAHAMTPMQGQGANMSIEDAGSLRLLLDPKISRENVPSFLKQIEAMRKPRATQVLLDTRSIAENFSLDAIAAKREHNFGPTQA
ncbi:FAD binding domain-containing protein [Fusarium falciforme]|uniref:FAD binding domain-containing protein n=1 Tax=Fusarium falciforme TaxID=195108 RepID=UPI002300AD93|nr:FAD binding domain-containing protein [Fusarium falciforme]WAO97006.1 FAD binding domain-containing protein [Fusarium falciforme]